MKKYLCFCFIFAFFSGCGKAPLFNHKEEAPPLSERAQQSSVSTNCSLKWNFPENNPNQICAKIIWNRAAHEGENYFQIEFSDSISGRNLQVSATMPDMDNHGTAPVELRWISPTIIEVRDLWLVMPGRWLIHLLLNNQEQSLEVTI